MTRQITINDRVIGDGVLPYLVCEAEINHDGSLEKAIKMINAAKECGADAIKFQFIIADNIAEPENPYYKLFKKVELTKEDFIRIKKAADGVGITCFATVPDLSTVEWVPELGFPAVKIGSTNITNLPLLEEVAKLGVPIILSTGMSILDEVRDALNVIGHDRVILLHCTVGYPIDLSDVNLKMMSNLKDEFQDYNIGFSDHTEGYLAPVLAVSMGAVLIEKHFTLDKNSEGPDHHFSATPQEMKELADHIRNIPVIMGKHKKQPTEKEKKVLKSVRRFVVASRDLEAGTLLNQGDLHLKRINPSVDGIEPKYLHTLRGKRTNRPIKKGEPITMDVLS
jgi:sialic acid synthase SpsE